MKKKPQNTILIAIAICTIVSLYFKNNTHDNKFHIIFLNIGQGDATLIITPDNKRILIDAGPDNSILNTLPEYIPFFDKEIDLFILTHPDKDHIFGSIELLKRYKVQHTLNPAFKDNSALHKQYLQNHLIHNTKYLIADPQFDLQIDKDTYINILSKNTSAKKVKNKNDNSLVFTVTHKEMRVLFSGDAEERQEKEIIENYKKETVRSDILQVGHHGSKTSSHSNFIKNIEPKISILSYGKDNKFKHPHPQTIHNLKNSKQLHTKDGNIHFIF